MPEGIRAELIEGEIYDMAPPSRNHQDIVAFFTKAIGGYIDANRGACKVYPSPFAVFLKTEENEENFENYVESDISVICNLDKLNKKGCKGAPDWVIKIVSPSSRKMDDYLKLTLYQMNDACPSGGLCASAYTRRALRLTLLILSRCNRTSEIHYNCDFKSGFRSNEKGSTNRFLLVASIYNSLGKIEKTLRFVRQNDDENNHYLQTLRNSSYWDVFCADDCYAAIKSFTGFDIRA